MLRAYGASVAKRDRHATGRPNQDARAAWVSDDGTVAVAAVADGLGSERLSDVGSSVAAETAVAYCREHLAAGLAAGAALTCLRGAYRAAWEAVVARASEMGEPAGEFDTTLCLAALAGGTLLWGQSGDSGLAACMADGSYRLVTRMQRDDEGRVFPLCFEDRWEFGELEGVSTVLLCTDGVLEGMIAPPILAAHTDCPLDRSMAHMFLHPRPGDAEDLAGVERAAFAHLEAYPPELVDDDKTVEVLFDDAALPVLREEGYYAAPDWEAICAAARAALYGGAGE